MEMFGWEEASRELARIERALPRAIERAKERAGVYMAGKIRKGIRDSAPGGKAFVPLHEFTLKMRQGKSTKPLIWWGDLLNAVTYQIDGDSVFVGVLRTARAKAKKRDRGEGYLANIAEIQEHGRIIRVTPKMRAWLHRHGLHLKATTNFIRIPPRPFIKPTGEAEAENVLALFERTVRRVIEGAGTTS